MNACRACGKSRSLVYRPVPRRKRSSSTRNPSVPIIFASTTCVDQAGRDSPSFRTRKTSSGGGHEGACSYFLYRYRSGRWIPLSASTRTSLAGMTETGPGVLARHSLDSRESTGRSGHGYDDQTTRSSPTVSVMCELRDALCRRGCPVPRASGLGVRITLGPRPRPKPSSSPHRHRGGRGCPTPWSAT